MDVVLVLDIGKTNKKIALYDQSMNLIDMISRNFPALERQGYREEQVDSIEQWFLGVMADVAAKHTIRAISITTHGACAVCVNEKGEPAVPVLDYTTEVSEDVHTRFCNSVGSAPQLQISTNTAEVRPLINVAKLLFYTKELFQKDFTQVKHILMYPQYFAYRLTGQIWADYTYLGCHTYLWDFEQGQYSHVADSLGIRDLLPSKVSYPGDSAGNLKTEIAQTMGVTHAIPVLIGVHDSNSSLIPYLINTEGDFMLNSTGTWCVAMHPETKAQLKPEDIGKTVFYNLSVNNSPVKTAIFLGGLEFQTWTEYLQGLHGRTDYPEFNNELAQHCISECKDFILPGVVQGAGQYPQSVAALVTNNSLYLLQDLRGLGLNEVPEILQSYEKAYTVLLLSLALHTKAAFEQAGLTHGSVESRNGQPIYIEGKFRETRGYTILLASLFPGNPVYTTEVQEATSYGAALLGWAGLLNRNLDEMKDLAQFEKQEVPLVLLDDLDAYIRINNTYLQ